DRAVPRLCRSAPERLPPAVEGVRQALPALTEREGAEVDAEVEPPDDRRHHGRCEEEAAPPAVVLPRRQRERHERERLLDEAERREQAERPPTPAVQERDEGAEQERCAERLARVVRDREDEAGVERDGEPGPRRPAQQARQEARRRARREH